MTKLWILAIGASVMLTSCLQDDDAGKPANGMLQLSFTGLTDLGPNHRYEAWVINDGSPKSAGTFTVDATGKASRTSFPYDRKELHNASQVIVTIEPATDNEAGPSTVTVLAGNFNSENAELTTMHPDVLGASFSGLTGNYVLTSPTTPDAADDMRGLWFAQTNGSTFSPGLNMLPPLSSAWRYEAWILINNQPVSMGKFQLADRADQSNRFGGSLSPLPFPGEDFIANAPNGVSFPQSLAGSQVMITVEPYNDNDEKPFMMQPFKSIIPVDAAANTNYALQSQAEQGMPKGNAIR